MWLNENEFEEALASYWESEEEQDAIFLRHDQATGKSRIFAARKTLGDIFKKIHGGVSDDEHGTFSMH